MPRSCARIARRRDDPPAGLKLVALLGLLAATRFAVALLRRSGAGFCATRGAVARGFALVPVVVLLGAGSVAGTGCVAAAPEQASHPLGWRSGNSDCQLAWRWNFRTSAHPSNVWRQIRCSQHQKRDHHTESDVERTAIAGSSFAPSRPLTLELVLAGNATRSQRAASSAQAVRAGVVGATADEAAAQLRDAP